MTKRRNIKPLEKAIEAALQPGLFIGYRESWNFDSDLEAVKEQIEKLVDGGQAEVGVDLYETFLGGCYEKAEEVDDSDGVFAMFVEDLFCSWIKARQAAGADPDETVELILAWVENDSYGFCGQLEIKAVEVFNRSGKKVFEKVVRSRFEAQLAQAERDDPDWKPAYGLRRSADILKAIYASRRNAGDYLSICQTIGLSPEDCEVLADIHRKKHDYAEALTWVEHGLELEGGRKLLNRSSYSLKGLKQRLLEKLGRGDEALELAWNRFREEPSDLSLGAVLKYAGADQAVWLTRVLEEVETAAPSIRIPIYMKTKAWDRLADLSLRAAPKELQTLSHYTAEPAAKKLEKSHPAAAARLFCALGMRIVEARKSKFYHEALRNFRSAKGCYTSAGLEKEWDAVVRKVRARHSRKTSFMPGFERIASGHTLSASPTFTDKARRRWAEKARR